jgi:hypothetical protein
MNNETRFGYWSDVNQPIKSISEYIVGFLDKIHILQIVIDNFYNFDLDLDIFYEQLLFELSIKFKSYCGFSYCRMCNKHNNGNKDIIFKTIDEIVYVPDGYLHYILNHAIYVPNEFQNFIVNFDIGRVLHNINITKEFYRKNKANIQQQNMFTNMIKIMSSSANVQYTN